MKRRPRRRCGLFAGLGFLHREFTIYAVLALFLVEAIDGTLWTRVGIRRRLGMLRTADERAALVPQPGVERLGDLIEGVRSAGLAVDLRVEGATSALPPGVDVSAYRIVQEALTNALKHAGPARRA